MCETDLSEAYLNLVRDYFKTFRRKVIFVVVVVFLFVLLTVRALCVQHCPHRNLVILWNLGSSFLCPGARYMTSSHGQPEYRVCLC